MISSAVFLCLIAEVTFKYLHVFLIAMHEIASAAEVYLEPFQTYVIEILCENSKWILTLNSRKALS